MKLEGGARIENALRQGAFPAAGRPTVSIITVVKNGRNVVGGAIRSVLTQDYPNIEYVVIDGGSQDGTVEALRAYGTAIDYWVSEPDEGIADAFNKGIKLTTGEILGIINADDWYKPNAISWVVSIFESNPAADVVCGALERYRDGRVVRTAFSDPNDPLEILHPATFVRRRRYERSGLFDKTYECSMDYELLLRFKLQGAIFVALPEVIAGYRVGGLSDRQWFKANFEVARARRLAGVSPWRVRFLYYGRILCRWLYLILQEVLSLLGLRGNWRALLPRRRRKDRKPNSSDHGSKS